MITGLYSVYDGAVKAYLPPFHARSEGEARRSFQEAVNKGDHQFNKHASDYVLFYMGSFDDATGLFEVAAGEVLPRRVVAALEVLEDDPVFPANKRLPL